MVLRGMPVSSGYMLVHLHKSATQKKDTAKSAVVDFDRTLPSAQGGANYMVHTTFNTGGAIRVNTIEATHEHTPFSTGRRGTK